MEHPRYVFRHGGATKRTELTRGGRIRIGRHPSNDIVIDHASVSRFHARVTWPAELPQPVIEDLGSLNGTFVGGPAIRRAALEERATLGIGRVVLLAELEHPSLIADAGADECRLFSQWAESDVAGRLGPSRTLRDLLLDLERGRRTGTLHLQRPGREARLTLAAGRIIDARAGDRAGVSVLRSALEAFDEASFSLRPDVEPRESTFSVTPRELFALGRPTDRLERGPILDAGRGSARSA